MINQLLMLGEMPTLGPPGNEQIQEKVKLPNRRRLQWHKTSDIPRYWGILSCISFNMTQVTPVIPFLDWFLGTWFTVQGSLHRDATQLHEKRGWNASHQAWKFGLETFFCFWSSGEVDLLIQWLALNFWIHQSHSCWFYSCCLWIPTMRGPS